jgi:hypothetical protein
MLSRFVLLYGTYILVILIRALITGELFNLEFLREPGLSNLINFAIISALLPFLWVLRIDDLSITISRGSIEGPTGLSIRRDRFPLARLDRAASAQRPWYQKLIGYRYLRSTDGVKIRVEQAAFAPSTLRALGQRLGE